jgi:chromosome segregation ATPase
MNRIAALTLLATLSVLPARAQSADASTLQAILTELRSMHNDVRLSQTTQILLTELQMQQGAVTRASQKRDDVRARLNQAQAQQKNMASQIERMEEQDTSGAMTDSQKKQAADTEDRLKSMLPQLKAQEQQDANDLQDAENQLSKEQTALDNIQGQLNDIMKKLQPIPSSAP